MAQKFCFYTGVEFVDIPLHDHSRTFDRIDNTKGYVGRNVVACTKHFNSIKGRLTPDDIKLLYEKVIRPSEESQDGT
jgi:hypothetical protein